MSKNIFYRLNSHSEYSIKVRVVYKMTAGEQIQIHAKLYILSSTDSEHGPAIHAIQVNCATFNIGRAL